MCQTTTTRAISTEAQLETMPVNMTSATATATTTEATVKKGGAKPKKAPSARPPRPQQGKKKIQQQHHQQRQLHDITNNPKIKEAIEAALAASCRNSHATSADQEERDDDDTSVCLSHGRRPSTSDIRAPSPLMDENQKKRVRFPVSMVQIRRIPSHRTLTPAQKSSIYLTKEDYERIQSEAITENVKRKVVGELKHDKNNNDDDDDIIWAASYAPPDRYTNDSAAVSSRTIIRQVLDNQHRASPDMLAILYRNFSSPSIHAARLLALHNSQEALVEI